MASRIPLAAVPQSVPPSGRAVLFYPGPADFTCSLWSMYFMRFAEPT